MTTKKSKSRSSSHKANTAIRSNPALWERVKNQVKRGSKGGPAGKWSARKAQLSVKLYKQKGGKYKGPKSSKNSLTKWSKEKWGYVSGGGGKRKYGRYLPEVVRKHLSKSASRSENRKKGTKHGKKVSYGKEVRSLMKKFGITKGRSKSRS
jgi:hypothetical protein